MEYQRILHEVLNAELQKAMWIYEIYLLLVVGTYGLKKEFSSFFSQLSSILCTPLEKDHLEIQDSCPFQMSVRMLDFSPDSF